MTHAPLPRTAFILTGATLLAALTLPAQAQGPRDGVSRAPAPIDVQAALKDARAEKSAAFDLDRIGALAPLRTIRDDLGMRHERFQQVYRGVPVFGGEVIYHYDAQGRRVRTTDTLRRDVAVSVRPTLRRAEALELALTHYEGAPYLTAEPTVDLWILRQEGRDSLAWRVQLERIDGSADTARPVFFIDAHSEEVILSYDNLQTQAATGQGATNYSGTVPIGIYQSGGDYYLEDRTSNHGTFTYNGGTSDAYYVTDPDTNFYDNSQNEAVDLHYAQALTLDFYASAFGRAGINGSNGPGVVDSLSGSGPVISAFANYGSGYNNAFWSGSYFVAGDGDGSTFTPLTTVDVVAHEMTHGLTQYTANLTYQGESGALNEAMSDIFGALVERSAYGQSGETWLIGEDCYTPNTAGDALRYMNNPTADGSSRDHYSSRYTGFFDNGGVHYNSGIANLAFYLTAVGGAHPRLGGDTVAGIGADAAGQIYYRALSNYMTSSTNFAGARSATLSAASDLYGAGSAQYLATGDAWAAVGVGARLSGGDPGDPPTGSCAGDSYTGTLSGSGDSDQQPDGTYYYASSGAHEGDLAGPSGADFDLYLYKWSGGRWKKVAGSTSPNSQESITYSGGSGYYTWLIDSYSGSGSYSLCLDTP